MNNRHIPKLPPIRQTPADTVLTGAPPLIIAEADNVSAGFRPLLIAPGGDQCLPARLRLTLEIDDRRDWEQEPLLANASRLPAESINKIIVYETGAASPADTLEHLIPVWADLLHPGGRLEIRLPQTAAPDLETLRSSLRQSDMEEIRPTEENLLIAQKSRTPEQSWQDWVLAAEIEAFHHAYRLAAPLSGMALNINLWRRTCSENPTGVLDDAGCGLCRPEALSYPESSMKFIYSRDRPMGGLTLSPEAESLKLLKEWHRLLAPQGQILLSLLDNEAHRIITPPERIAQLVKDHFPDLHVFRSEKSGNEVSHILWLSKGIVPPGQDRLPEAEANKNEKGNE
jgi:hypothetical protein